ncbi:amino acid transporter [Sphingomonas sp. UYP23]
MIGSGIFVLPAQLAPYGWTSIAAWIVGIGGAMLIAWVLARLTAAMPGATGVVAMCAHGLGPLCGVLVGWSYWIGIWSANAIIALTAIRYLAQFVPMIGATTLAQALSATVLIWLMTLLNLGGARLAGAFQIGTTVLKLVPLCAIVLILAGIVWQGGAGRPIAPHPAFAWHGLTPALTFAFYALVGFEAASVAAERVRDPARTIVRAMLSGLALTGTLYLVVCTGIIFALPTAAVANAQAPFAVFVSTYWGAGRGSPPRASRQLRRSARSTAGSWCRARFRSAWRAPGCCPGGSAGRIRATCPARSCSSRVRLPACSSCRTRRVRWAACSTSCCD